MKSKEDMWKDGKVVDMVMGNEIELRVFEDKEDKRAHTKERARHQKEEIRTKIKV